MRERVLVAMSGGVDSSVAAALLVEEGYEVVGVTMQIWPEEAREAQAHRGGCCSLSAVADARRVAELLGIPYYVLNLRDRFRRDVIDYFTASYRRGETPNPCIACNRTVKFDALLHKARELGARYLATGHYARVRWDGRRHRLLAAADPDKDQSYVLYHLTQAELAQVLFPVGRYPKEAIRRKARLLGLPVWDKPDSQELCFVTGDYRELLREGTSAGGRPAGRFVRRDGTDLGPAPGVAFFTVGQRRGIGIPSSRPLYVVDLDPETERVVVGYEEELYAESFAVGELSFTAGVPGEVFEAEVQIRAHGRRTPATVRLRDTVAEVTVREPVRAVTAGQAAVFYDGEEVLGGGKILRRQPPLPGLA